MTFPTLYERLVKGAPLSHIEGDANWDVIFAALTQMVPYKVAQRYDGWPRTSNNSNDATNIVLASAVVPGGMMRPNSKIAIISDWDVPAANTKHVGVNFGGSNVGGAFTIVSPTLSLKVLTEVQNLNSLMSQSSLNGEAYARVGAARIATTIDTSGDVTIDFTGRWSANVTAGQVINLLGYSIYHFPG